MDKKALYVLRRIQVIFESNSILKTVTNMIQAWLITQELFLSGVPVSQLANATAALNLTASPPDPRTSEDCLFLG